MTRDIIRTERIGPVTVIHLQDDRALNALGSALVAGLADALEHAQQDPEVRAVVITGSDRAFCAGAHIPEVLALREALTADPDAEVYLDRLFDLLAASPQPVIAAVRGLALGGGCELALACDLIVAGPRALFALPEVSVGVIPGGGGTQLMTRRIGWSRAADLIFTARRIDAEEALRLGLADRFVDDAKGEALALASTIAKHSPVGVRNAKAAMRGGLDVSLDEGLDLEDARWHDTAFSADRAEGVRAFAEKRTPEWPGLG